MKNRNREYLRRGETVAPLLMLSLMGNVGVTRASKMLGVSTTTLHNARRNNKVSRVIELASEHALHSLSGVMPATGVPPPMTKDTTVCLMEVTKKQGFVIQQLAEAMNVPFLQS